MGERRLRPLHERRHALAPRREAIGGPGPRWREVVLPVVGTGRMADERLEATVPPESIGPHGRPRLGQLEFTDMAEQRVTQLERIRFRTGERDGELLHGSGRRTCVRQQGVAAEKSGVGTHGRREAYALLVWPV